MVRKTHRVEPHQGEPRVRTRSYTRFASPLRRPEGALVPSTLPPAPFEREVDVHEIAWWLEQHMGLAANVLCLEQIMEGWGDATHRAAPAIEVKAVVARIDRLRDALYELYCDAADRRLESLRGPEGSLSIYVRSLYACCESLIDALVIVAAALRSGTRDLSLVTEALRDAVAQIDDAAAHRLEGDVQALGIALGSPVEPLRRFPQNVAALVRVGASLRAQVVRLTA